FKDPKHGEFTLPDDSPAFKVGFKRFDYSKAGVFGDDAWKKLAADYNHPVRPMAPPKPAPVPVKINDDFESPRSTPVKKAALHDEGKNLIRISTDKPFAGEKCLEVNDSPEMKAAYNPHLFFTPNYTSGTAVSTFALRVQKNSHTHIEWRDDSSPYKTGPSIHIDGGKLTASNVPLLDFPLDRWVNFEITAKVGEAADGSWNLTLIFADGAKKTFEKLPPVSKDWRNLNWVGWCNLGQSGENTSFFIDNLVIDNQ
ncbi:MAG: hypothetical protein LBN39_06595, partial [Planctomycetaceae bacterium]|nr:hypothetical protein [Planctomycetaceae bacterium]